MILKSGAVLGMPDRDYDEAMDALGAKLLNDFYYTRRMDRADIERLVKRTFDDFDRIAPMTWTKSIL